MKKLLLLTSLSLLLLVGWNTAGEAYTGVVTHTYYDDFIGGTVAEDASWDADSGAISLRGWYDNDWPKRHKITIQKDKVIEHLTDFPVMVTELNLQSTVFTDAKSDGSDLVFTGSTGVNKLKHEIEMYDATNETAVIWVKVPVVHADENTDIFVYFGNAAAANQEDTTNVWDDDFRAVWHMYDWSTSKINESTANRNTGNKLGAGEPAVVSAANGKFGECQEFDGSNDKISVPNHSSLNFSSELTVEAWIYPDEATNWRTIVSKFDGAAEDVYLFLNLDKVGCNLEGPHAADWKPDIAIAESAWTYVALTYDGNNIRLYKNGTMGDTDVKSGALGLADNTNPLYMGYNTAWSEFYDGKIEEVRYSRVARSEGWIKTTYNNLSDPSAFAVESTVELK